MSDEVVVEPAPKKRTLRARVVRGALLVLGVALLAGFLVAAGPAEVAANFGKIGWGFGYLFLVAMAWRACATTGSWVLLSPERRVSWVTMFLIRSAGESVNMLSFFGNVAGEPIKAVLLKRHLGGTESTSMVLLDKTIFFVASMVFMASGTIIGAWVLGDRLSVVITSLALLVPWLLALSWIVWRQAKGDFIKQLTRLLRVLRIRLSDKTLEKLTRIDGLMSTFWRGHKARFVMSFLAHLLGRILRALDVWVCVWLLGLHISWYAAYFSAAAGMLVSASFVFIPGGLGASEGGHAFVFEAIGLGFSAGVTVGVIRRIRNYLIAAVGYLLLVFWPAAAESRSE